MQLDADLHQLAEQVSALLADAASPSAALLQLALRCLQTGHPQLAARLACSDRLSAVHRAELDALNTIDLLSLYSSWKTAATAGWQAALSPDALLRLGLLLSRSEGDAMARLRSDLQEVFGEGMVQADRPQALQLWDQLCRRCPDWSWARLMACDLALQEQQLDLCHHHIEAAPAAERRSISMLDVEARLRLQQEFVQEALRCWGAAIEQARAEGQFKWAIALVRRRHAANMAHLKGTPSQAIAFEAELDRISGYLSSVAERYGIELPPPSSPGDLPDAPTPPGDDA
jgi:hypothetical protein